MKILVTGGAGYIGSHTTIQLLAAGHEVVILDNLSNSKREAVTRIAELSGREPEFRHTDLRDADALDDIFSGGGIEAVIHFAGLKSVGESVQIPLAYYDNNIVGTLRLLEAMARANCRTLVFSSSATVYGAPASLPIREDFPLSATNPYGRTKLVIEEILQDLYRAEPNWRIALLRYFNPVGAHASGRLGEDPCGIPNNLMPFIAQVAVGRREELLVFGNDYPTPDGTGVRDYIHVEDLAEGHLRALGKLAASDEGGIETYNLGTGDGHSVLEVVAAFARASGCSIPYRTVERRPGDIAACYADPSKAQRDLAWQARRTLDEMCTDTWRWQQSNPEGLQGASYCTQKT